MTLADLGASGPGIVVKCGPLSREEGRGVSRKGKNFLRFELQNFIFPIIFMLFPIHNSALHVGTPVYNKLEIFVSRNVVNISEDLMNALVAQYFTRDHVKAYLTGSTHFSIF
jgi:hypothetical protein